MKPYAKFILAAAIILFPAPAFAQQKLTPDDIISSLGGGTPSAGSPSAGAPSSGALTPEDIVSTLGGKPAAAEGFTDNSLFRGLQEKARTRSFTLKDREEVESFSASRPKVDIEVYFDYNSAEITPKARSTLNVLGAALQDPRLAGKKFIFIGHTDAKGDPEYNIRLSDRRAEAVKRYIVSAFSVDASGIALIGDGARKLKTPANPFADENRRVEVVRSD
jgi:outer membrane protein OmpA-like peptidoglycan-associated protein